MEDGGVDFGEYITKKYGESAAKRFLGGSSQLYQSAARVGLRFKEDRKVFPSRRAHSLMEHIKLTKGEDSDEANTIMLKLFKGYFEEGLSPNSVENLRAIVEDVFGKSDVSEKALIAAQDDEMLKHVLEKDSYHKHQGVSGVPFFIIERTGEEQKKRQPVSFSGAYPPDFIAQELEEIMEE